MGVPQITSSPIYCDNRSAIQIAHNDVFHERTKHIEIDCHFIRHHLQHGILHLHSVTSVDQLADILPNLIYRNDSMILSLNSSWFCPLEFEGGVRRLYFRNIIFS
jgi:hypothetical protein